MCAIKIVLLKYSNVQSSFYICDLVRSVYVSLVHPIYFPVPLASWRFFARPFLFLFTFFYLSAQIFVQCVCSGSLYIEVAHAYTKVAHGPSISLFRGYFWLNAIRFMFYFLRVFMNLIFSLAFDYVKLFDRFVRCCAGECAFSNCGEWQEAGWIGAHFFSPCCHPPFFLFLPWLSAAPTHLLNAIRFADTASFSQNAVAQNHRI